MGESRTRHHHHRHRSKDNNDCDFTGTNPDYYALLVPTKKYEPKPQVTCDYLDFILNHNQSPEYHQYHAPQENESTTTISPMLVSPNNKSTTSLLLGSSSTTAHHDADDDVNNIIINNSEMNVSTTTSTSMTTTSAVPKQKILSSPCLNLLKQCFITSQKQKAQDDQQKEKEYNQKLERVK